MAAHQTVHPAAGDYQIKLATVDAFFARQYRLHVPRRYSAETAAPLVVVVHGAFSNAAETAQQSGFSTLAEREGFVVLYPEGIGLFGLLRHWNAGHCCGRAEQIGLDDVGYIEQAISDVRARLNIDAQRIYLVGMSNGGMLAHRFAAEKSRLLAAAAVVAGAIGSHRDAVSAPWRLPVPLQPVPMLIMHGLEDDIVPFRGGVSPRKGGPRHFLSATEAATFWTTHNHCDPISARTYLLSGSVIRDHWRSKDSGAEVYLYALKDWGHSWPSPHFTNDLPSAHPMRSFNSAEVIWNFFKPLRKADSRGDMLGQGG